MIHMHLCPGVPVECLPPRAKVNMQMGSDYDQIRHGSNHLPM
jgi:hypothetical protein